MHYGIEARRRRDGAHPRRRPLSNAPTEHSECEIPYLREWSVA